MVNRSGSPCSPTADVAPKYVAHADWGVDPLKRQVALAVRGRGAHYHVRALAAAENEGVAIGDIRRAMHLGPKDKGDLLAGFDFPIGFPRTYAHLAGVRFFPDFLREMGSGRWSLFESVASTPAEISLERPFYPARTGHASRLHLSESLGLSEQQMRRRCEARDAGTMFWTLGPTQSGKGALKGWRAFANGPGGSLRIWPYHGSLHSLLDATEDRVVVAETYPREFYRYIRPDFDKPTRWSKQRQSDRLKWIPTLLEFASEIGVTWDSAVLERIKEGLSPGRYGEDEFDAISGVLGAIAVVKGIIDSGEPSDDPAVQTVEGWILGREGDKIKK